MATQAPAQSPTAEPQRKAASPWNPVDTQHYALMGRAREFIAIYHTWANSDDESSVPPARFWERLESFLAVYDAGPCPPLFVGAIETAIARLRLRLQEFDQSEVVIPGAQFHDAMMGLERELDKFERRLQSPVWVEPIQQVLKSDSCPSDTQIAKMYSLIDPNTGHPQVHLVQQERAQPGSIIAADWLHPRERARREQFQAWEDGRQLFEKADPEQNIVKSQRAPAPESWAELYWTGVDLPQAAKMKQVTLEEAEQKYKEVAAKPREESGVDYEQPAVSLPSHNQYRKYSTGQLRLACQQRGIMAQPSDKDALMVEKLRQFDKHQKDKKASE